MRLIDADALIKAMGVHTYMQTEWTPATAWGVPIVDAVEVVRCNDCKYYEETDSRIGTCLLTISGAEVGGFCAWGEWRGDGDVV